MGDRVTVSFKEPDGEESPALYHHWGGKAFPKLIRKWYKEHYKQPEFQGRYASKDFVEFLAWLGKNHLLSDFDSIDIYKDKDDIDASDNGHYTIFTKDGRMTNGSGEYIE